MSIARERIAAGIKPKATRKVSRKFIEAGRINLLKGRLQAAQVACRQGAAEPDMPLRVRTALSQAQHSLELANRLLKQQAEQRKQLKNKE